MTYKKKIEQVQRCPFEYGLRVFGGKWKARILCILSQHKPLRFHQLRSELGDITDAVLTGALQELLTEGVIRREAFNEIPPRVEYCLTEKGESAIPLLQDICAWSRQQFTLDTSALLSPCRQCPKLNEEGLKDTETSE